MRKGTAQESAVFIVDDGEGQFGEVAHILGGAGFAVHMLPSPSVVAEQSFNCHAACVLLDLHARAFDTLQLLVKLGCATPVVFLTDRLDVRGSVMAIKSGAIDVLVKPIDQNELLSVIRAALAQDFAARLARALHSERRQRFALLTPREHEVCGWVSVGLRNKQIAARIGIAEKTVKVHRGQAMRKLGVRSVPELVRIVDGLRPRHADTRSPQPIPDSVTVSGRSARAPDAIHAPS